MELDQLKQQWQKASAQDTPPHRDVRHILRQAGKGPLASLKRNFRKQIILLVLVFFIIANQFRDRGLFNNLFVQFYLVFCLSLCIFFYYNYRMVKRLEKTDHPLIDHLINQVTLLEKRMRWHRMFTRIAVIVLILLVEIIPLFHNDRMLQKWHAVAPLIRIAVYAGFILLHYYVGKKLAGRRYGQHLQRLKNLLTDAA